MKTKNQTMLDRAQKQPRSESLQFAESAVQAEAERLYAQMRQLDELEREVKAGKEELIRKVRPWHEHACQRNGKYAATVQIGPLKINFQHRYCDISPDRYFDLQQAFDNPALADHYFTTRIGIKVKAEVADDPLLLDELLDLLRERLSVKRFERYFETTQKLQPFPKFTEEQAGLPAETREKLAPVVRQVVSVSAAGPSAAS